MSSVIYKETERRFMPGVIWRHKDRMLELKVELSTKIYVILRCDSPNRLHLLLKSTLDKDFIYSSEEVYWPKCSNKDCICGNIIEELGSNAFTTIWKRCEVCNENNN